VHDNAGQYVILAFLALGCGGEASRESERLSSVTQEIVRTSNCLDGAGAPITYTASPPAWPLDASTSIQQTINAAKSRALTIGGTCTVRAYVPNGTWLLENSLFVPGRVHLIGQDINATRLIKVYSPSAASAIELQDKDVDDCTPISHVKVQQLRIEMRDDINDATPPEEGSGHCIRSRTGMSDFEIRNVNLKHCRFYGIGLQYANNDDVHCPRDGSPYQRFTIKGVRLEWAGSDGIDIKSLDAAATDATKQNADGELHDLCFANIGQNGDGNWDSAFDLSGNNLWVRNVQAINDTKLALTAGIDLGGGARRVTNSVIEQFYVKRYDLALTADTGSTNVLVREGALKESSYGANLAPGTSNIDTSGGSVCASFNGHDLENGGQNNDWSWGSCPALANPACSY
jgi:hypothetical protein